MSFFDRQPALFDSKKRFGQQQNDKNSDENDSMPESWVELAPSRTSLCSSVEAVIIDRDVFGEAGNSKDSRLSPVSVQSPHVELESNLEQVKYRLAKDVLPSGPRNTDWIWDWSSRPEANPPLKFLRHRGQAGSTLTTPPNTPDLDLVSDYEYKLEKIPNVFCRFKVVVGLVVSNLVTFMLGATIGFCICKKLSRNQPH